MAKKNKGEPTADELQEQIDGLRAIAEALGVDDVDAALDDIAYRRDGTPVWLGAPGEPKTEGGEPKTEGGEPSPMRSRARGTLRGGGRTGPQSKPVKDMSEGEKVRHYREIVRPDIMGESNA